jgi:tRNA dimethylallyltransferase
VSDPLSNNSPDFFADNRPDGGPPRVVCLAGPTAAGKTGIALELVRRYPFEIISVDSAMVYRRMNIGTAKPDATELAAAPHRLIDIRDPWESYSAGDFCADARQLIVDISAAGKMPLLVGGTFLYFRALRQGLAMLPEADPELRAQLDERGQAQGWPALHQELARVDPEAAVRIEPGDRQRIQRALEVYLITGEPITELQKIAPQPSGFEFLNLSLVPGDREELYRRIEARFARMISDGFVDEVAALRAMPQMDGSRPAMRAVGYRQLWQHLEGEVDLGEAQRRAVVATRRYAKRQLTWLRSEPHDRQFDCLSPGALESICRVIDAGKWFGAISSPSS